MIVVNNLSKSFDSRCVLDSISLELPDRGLVAIISSSGSGKTTLMKCLSGLISDYEGNIIINRINLNKLNDRQIEEFRLRNIGFVFQNFNLLNLETALDNVMLTIDATSTLPTKYKRKRAVELLELVGLKEKTKTLINRLSGGEKQRVAIARAIASGAQIILADEPTGSLDSKTGQDIMAILKSLSTRMLVIIATHDENILAYADARITIEEGRARYEQLTKCVKPYSDLITVGKGMQKYRSSLSFSYQVRHAYHRLKNKKWRSILANFMLFISLAGISTALVISSGVKDSIQQSFSSLVDGQRIAMSLKQNNLNTFSGIYSAPYDKMEELYKKYESRLDGIGATYLVNFEDFFKDQNELNLYSVSHRYQLSSFSMRSVNDYQFFDSSSIESFYPRLPEALADDELVLSLPYVDMVNLCFKLQIQRNYQSLGEYLDNYRVDLSLAVANRDWMYEDEQIFRLKAVIESEKPLIYHRNPIWNEIVFEKMMLLPSIDSEHSSFPWEMYKTYYLKTKDEPSSFLSEIAFDRDAQDFVFERTSNLYHPLLCRKGSVCHEKKVIVYYVDKHAIKLSDIEKIQKVGKNLDSFYLATEYGYASYASSMLSGFAKNVFVSLQQEKLDAAIDADTALKDENKIEISLPNGVVQGNYMNSVSGGLRFSSKPKVFIAGNPPENLDEIAISKRLAEELDLGNDVLNSNMLLAVVKSETIQTDGIVEKEYATVSVEISGIVDSDELYLYHSNDWTVSFFRDKVGISSFHLTPYSVVFEIDDSIDASGLAMRLNKMFRDYTFTNPIEQVSSSLESTMSFVQTALLVLSLIAMIISLVLLSTVILLSILDSKGEIEMFHHLGLPRREIVASFIVQSFLQCLLAFAVASLETVIIEYLLSFLISDIFSSPIGFTINLFPIVIILVISLVSAYVIGRLVVSIVMHKTINVEGGSKSVSRNVRAK